MSSVRTVRPRPLGVDERIPVFWAGREVPPEVKAVDGGSLYRYLGAGSPPSGQKRQRGDKYHAPREVRWGAVLWLRLCLAHAAALAYVTHGGGRRVVWSA